MEFGSQCDSTPKNLNININGIKIKRVESTKYLGLVFDSNMRWNEHILYVYNKTKYLILIFYKLMKIMSTGCLRMVYYAFFHSIIFYGDRLGRYVPEQYQFAQKINQITKNS